MKKKYLIFGATGSIGSNLASQFYKEIKDCHLIGKKDTIEYLNNPNKYLSVPDYWNRNSIFWIKGVNGSGKSTLMKIVASQIEDYEGNVSYKNISIKKIGYEIHNEIFYLPSLSNLY